MRYAAPPYIRKFSLYFLCVGLCSLLIFPLQDTWQRHKHWMREHQIKRVDVVDSESTRSSSETRAQIEAVDRVSGHRTL